MKIILNKKVKEFIMTKKEAAKEIQDVMNYGGHTNILVWKEGRSWKTYSGLNSFSCEDVQEVNGTTFSYQDGDFSIKDVIRFLNEPWQ